MIKKKLTPLLRQYIDIKEKYKDCLIFFRLGDFYELFFEDAEIAAKELSITLTRRGQIDDKDIPMCGVPFFQGEIYVSKLLKKGFKVAICEQLEKPEESKKRGNNEIIKRKVIRVATPGTLTEEKELETPENNFLASIICKDNMLALSWIDISTGEINVKTCKSLDIVLSSLQEINPSEIIYSPEYLQKHFLENLKHNLYSTFTRVESIYFDFKNNHDLLKDIYSTNKIFHIEDLLEVHIKMLGSLIKYILYTQDGRIPPVKLPNKEDEKNLLEIDASSRKNLEIISSLNGDRKGSLLSAVNYTKTASGERKLINDLIYPLANLNNIIMRQDLVEFFYTNFNFLKKSFSEKLSKIPDFSRSIARLSLNRGGPRDLNNILRGLEISFSLTEILLDEKLIEKKSKNIINLIKPIIKNHNIKNVKKNIHSALEEKLPMHSRDGGFIKKGYDKELDIIREYRDNSKKIVIEIELKERAFTKVNNLRIKYNNFLGYFIEVSPSNKNNIKQYPERYIHRQTLKNCIRYTCNDLISISEKIINSNAKLLERELKIYKELVDNVIKNSQIILKMSDIVSRLDVAYSWATYAKNSKAIKPNISENNQYVVYNGRHPSVEKTHTQKFISNSCVLNKNDKNIFKLITGPNMSGKSTYLRQNAIILIMAQAGGFCPADEVKIGICDKLFCRVGSGDELAKGNSTFMVEMLETARILQNATNKSLVILDEIGRGTSTFDGMSIAWATIEHILEKIKCKTLFATHYNELSALKDQFKLLELNTFRVKEWKGDLVFLHEIIEGVAASSYGIQVAKMAGVPSQLTDRAENILRKLENAENKKKDKSKQLDINYLRTKEKDYSLFEEVIENIIGLNLNEVKPIEALNILNKYKELLEKKDGDL
tara:strand:+ start:3005 stop:5662 length:2658 start_codon:yes stop_codon:yes gene_type:complete